MEKQFNLEIAKILCNKNFNKNKFLKSHVENHKNNNRGERHVLILGDLALQEFQEHLELLKALNEYSSGQPNKKPTPKFEKACITYRGPSPVLTSSSSSLSLQSFSNDYMKTHSTARSEAKKTQPLKQRQRSREREEAHARKSKKKSSKGQHKQRSISTACAVRSALHHRGEHLLLMSTADSELSDILSEPADSFHMSPVFFPFVDSTLMYLLDRLFCVILKIFGFLD